MLKSFKEVMDKAQARDTRRLAVADAAGGSVIEALKEAADKDIIFPVLVGDPKKIQPIAEEKGLKNFELVEAFSPVEIGAKTVELVRNGQADMIMKGKVSTPVLMKAVLNKEKGLRKGKLLSHVAVTEVANYPKLMLFTDGGINIQPDIKAKGDILKNAIDLANGMGIERPKIAALSTIENVNPDMPETVDAALLTKMGQRGQFGNVHIEGPIAVDVILSEAAKQAKNFDTELTLDADIFLTPNISTCNMSIKFLIYLANALVGGLVVGATCPIVLLSRSDTADIKLASIALAAALD